MEARKSIKINEGDDIWGEQITEGKLKEEQERTNQLKKQYAKEETARMLHGKKPSAFYAGDEPHEETRKMIAERESRGYSGRG